jgi:hypothetical protein
MLLQPDASISLVGQTLHSDQKTLLDLTEDEAIRVSAVVTNLPHYGVLDTSTPMIYVNSLSEGKSNPMELRLIVDSAQKQRGMDTVQQFAQEQGSLKITALGQLKQQL